MDDDMPPAAANSPIPCGSLSPNEHEFRFAMDFGAGAINFSLVIHPLHSSTAPGYDPKAVLPAVNPSVQDQGLGPTAIPPCDLSAKTETEADVQQLAKMLPELEERIIKLQTREYTLEAAANIQTGPGMGSEMEKLKEKVRHLVQKVKELKDHAEPLMDPANVKLNETL